MRTTCPNCNNPLTIREAIQNYCNKCTSLGRSRHTVGIEASSSSKIRTNFDALISEELKKRSFKSAA